MMRPGDIITHCYSGAAGVNNIVVDGKLLPAVGTLAVGAPADLAIFRIVEGPVTFVDTNKNAFLGTRYLEPVKVIKGGRPHGSPFPNPFTYT